METVDITECDPTGDIMKMGLTKFADGSDVRREIGIKCDTHGFG